jgi:hypothetical protein
MTQITQLDLFAGIPVADYAAARPWDERLLGAPPHSSPRTPMTAVWDGKQIRSPGSGGVAPAQQRGGRDAPVPRSCSNYADLVATQCGEERNRCNPQAWITLF